MEDRNDVGHHLVYVKQRVGHVSGVLSYEAAPGVHEVFILATRIFQEEDHSADLEGSSANRGLRRADHCSVLLDAFELHEIDFLEQLHDPSLPS